MRAPLDRFFVRMDLPQLAVTSKDLEDRESRAALRALLDDAIAASPHATPSERAAGTVRMVGPVDVDALVAILPELESAPVGAVAPWTAYCNLLGTHVETDAGSSVALGAYRNALLKVFALLETLPMAEFHRVLTTSVNRTLDAALDTVLDELRSFAHVLAE